MSDLVSVIIPTYERTDGATINLITRALNSVQRQTYQNLEIIVVIDGISTEIKGYINKNYSKVQVIESIERVGGGTTRNLGITISQGDWIAFLDDDDEWEKYKIEEQITNIINRVKTTTSIFSFTSCYRNGEVLPQKKYTASKLSDFIFLREKLQNFGFIQTSTIMVNRKLINKVKFTDGLAKHQDWDFCLKVDEIEVEVIYVEKPLTYYHDDAPVNFRVGKSKDYNYSLKWINQWRRNISAEVYNSFIINFVFQQISEDFLLEKKEKRKKIIGLYCKLSGNGKYYIFNILKMIKCILYI